MLQKRYRTLLFIASIALVIFGIIMIYSASYIWADYKFNDSFKYVKQQLLFFVLGIFLIYFVTKIDYKVYYKKANLFLIICLLLLVLVLIPGIGVVRNGSRSWFGIGSFGIQPSEAVKLAMILWVSKYLSNTNKVYKGIKPVLPVLILLMLVFGLIMLQPDFGTGVILVMAIVVLLFVAGVNMKYFYILFAIGVVGSIGLIIIAPYRMSRITSFLNPWNDPLGSGFQIIQSLYAIGPGGLLGFGFLNSRQKHFYLPEPQTDFIFSIICEEFGVIGALFVVLMFFIIAYCGIKLALKEDNLFKKYLIFGLTFQIIFQAILNLCVVVGLIPVTGVTLPFLSYGGSSLLISMLSIGLILSVSKKGS